MKQFVFISILLLFSSQLKGQLSGTNYFEYQLGNIGNAVPADLSASYDQLNLNYRYNYLKANVRYEHFLSQTEESSYNRLTKYSFTYKKRGFDLTVGNFSEILGNGLLLRAYEVPGSVYEEPAYRSRYSFFRDLRGVSMNYRGDIGYVKLLRGASLANTLPPTREEAKRRPDLTEALETGLTFAGQNLGAVLMRNTNGPVQDHFYSLLLNGNLPANISYSFEYAHGIKNGDCFIRLLEDSRYGIYGSLNYVRNNLGISLEYKNYHNLLIGAGISDPPSLVKEHTYKLLNRSTHIPLYDDESGLQFDAYYSFEGGQRLVFNYSRAVNEIVSAFTFTEYFSELYMPLGKRHSLTLFADYAMDPWVFEDHRYTGGFIWEYEIAARHSALLEIEYQDIERESSSESQINNLVVVTGYSYSPSTSIGLTWEYSTDPLVTDGSESRYWIGLDFSHKLNQNNTLSLFAGERRGGPACSAGVCYETLDFRGFELRLKTKF